MTVNEYRTLDEVAKLEYIWKYGIRLIDRNDEIYFYHLFALGTFYVEVTRLKQKATFPEFLAFTDPAQLSPYLDQIDISDIIPSSAS